jgi:MFS family permease
LAQAWASKLNLWSLAGRSALLQDLGFRHYWISRALSSTAYNAMLYGFLILVVRETGSSIHTSLLILSLIIPPATLASISGVVTDRLPRGLILFVGHVLRALLAVAFVASGGNVWVIYGIALGFGIVGQFSGPVESALLPHIVERERLTAANSMFNLGGAVGQTLGVLILAPLFLKTVGADSLFTVIAMLYVVAAGLLLTVPNLGFRQLSEAQRHSVHTTFRGVRAEFAEGWQTLRRDRTAYMGMILLVLGGTSLLVTASLAPRFADQVLGISTENVIYVFAPAVAGVVLGLRLVDWLTHQVSKSWVVTAGFIMVVLSMVAMAMVPQSARLLENQNPLGLFSPGPFGTTAARVMVTLVFAGMTGFAYSVVNVAGRSLLNERVPVPMQGRVFAAQTVLSNLASIVPLLLAGALADWWGVSPVLIAIAVAVLVIALWGAFQTMTMRSRAPA